MKEENRNGSRDKPIAVYDSGVGGLPYLRWLLEQLPQERFIYLADHDHFPYGEKRVEELQEIIPASVARLIAETEPKMVVIACNTASVIALSELRARFGIPFVGVVPAIKPAAEQSANCRIGVFATRRTIEDPYTDDLVRRFADHCHVARYAEGRIVDFVERRFFLSEPQERRELLRPAAEYFLEEGVDHLVLACTHFVFLKEELEALTGGEIRVIDSREGVGRQVLRILRREELAAPGGERTEEEPHRFFITGDGEHEAYRSFAAHFGLSWGGAL
jgi:glutamate racemase